MKKRKGKVKYKNINFIKIKKKKDLKLIIFEIKKRIEIVLVWFNLQRVGY